MPVQQMTNTNTMQTTAMVAAGLVGTALVVWPLLIWNEVRKLEKPKYKVLKTLQSTGRFVPPLEIREYAPMLIAEVTFDKGNPGMREAMSGGFKAIAKFIFDSEGEGQKDDVTREKISMTSPVTAEMPESGGYKVAFVMPSHYTKETLPKPADSSVEIKSVDKQTLAALSFRGNGPREPQVEQRRQELLALLRTHNVSPIQGGATRVFQYFPPFAPGFIRLNELLLPVDPSSVGPLSVQQE